MTLLADHLTLDKAFKPHRTTDGYLAVRANAARTGIYDYRADEIGAPADKFSSGDIVKVYRDADDVFDEASVRSFIGRPITDNHPREAVTADNWKRNSRGVIMGAMRDGDHLAFDLVLMDGALIKKVESGKRELSNGYRSQLDFTPGTTPEGEHYDARMTNIRGNHVAVVDAGRAGPTCRIGDGAKFALCDQLSTTDMPKLSTPKEGRVKLTNLDGLSVNLEDSTAVEQALTRLDCKVTEAIAAADAARETHDKEVATRDAEIEKLKGQVVDQAKIDELADAKATVVEKAKAVCGDKLPDTAGKTVAEVQRMACDVMGIDVADRSEGYIEGRFEALTADSKTASIGDRKVAIPRAVTKPVTVGDNAMARDTVRAARYA